MGPFRRSSVLLSLPRPPDQLKLTNDLLRKKFSKQLSPFFADEHSKLSILPELHRARRSLRKDLFAPLGPKAVQSFELTEEGQELDRVAQIVRSVNDRQVLAELQDRLAESFYFRNDIERELKTRVKTLEQLETEDLDVNHIMALNSLAMTYLRVGDIACRDVIQDSQAILKTNDQVAKQTASIRTHVFGANVVTTLNQGLVHLLESKITDAKTAFTSVIESIVGHPQRLHFLDVEVAAAFMLGKVALVEGNADRAFDLWENMFPNLDAPNVAAQNARVACGMMTVELGYYCIAEKEHSAAEDMFATARSLLAIEGHAYTSARRLPAVVGLADLYTTTGNLLAAEGLYRRIDEDLAKIWGDATIVDHNGGDLGRFSAATLAEIWSRALESYANYLENPKFHEIPRDGEAKQARMKSQHLQENFSIIGMRIGKNVAPLWYFDVMIRRCQLPGFPTERLLLNQDISTVASETSEQQPQHTPPTGQSEETRSETAEPDLAPENIDAFAAPPNTDAPSEAVTAESQTSEHDEAMQCTPNVEASLCADSADSAVPEKKQTRQRKPRNAATMRTQQAGAEPGMIMQDTTDSSQAFSGADPADAAGAKTKKTARNKQGDAANNGNQLAATESDVAMHSTDGADPADTAVPKKKQTPSKKQKVKK